MSWFVLSAFAAPCDPTVLGPALDRAEEASRRADLSSLEAALDVVAGSLDCAGPRAIARHYRGLALLADLEDRPSAIDRSLEAMLAAHPLLPDQTDLLGSPALEAALHRAQEAGTSFRQSRPRLVNGVHTPLVPTTDHVGRDRRRGIRLTGVALGVLAAGAYGSAWVSRERFDATAGRPAAERLPSYRTTNGLALGAVGLAAASGSLLTIGFVL